MLGSVGLTGGSSFSSLLTLTLTFNDDLNRGNSSTSATGNEQGGGEETDDNTPQCTMENNGRKCTTDNNEIGYCDNGNCTKSPCTPPLIWTPQDGCVNYFIYCSSYNDYYDPSRNICISEKTDWTHTEISTVCMNNHGFDLAGCCSKAGFEEDDFGYGTCVPSCSSGSWSVQLDRCATDAEICSEKNRYWCEDASKDIHQCVEGIIPCCLDVLNKHACMGSNNRCVESCDDCASGDDCY